MNLKKLIIGLALPLTLISSACSSTQEKEQFLPEAHNDSMIAFVPGNNDMRISYIDVGQGDSEFIELPNGKTILIDASTNSAGNDVVNYIKSLGYSSIDYVVGTHPHEDHIGGLDDVINSFDVKNVYMPKVSVDTKTFEDVLDAIDNKGLKITTAKAGTSIIDDDNLKVNIVSPVADTYNEINDYSAVIRIEYGENSFLFTGDAEAYAESLITENVSADVLKVGHHGSSTSSTNEFLDKVSPSIAIISCGKDNKYGHPHDETLEKLSKRGIDVYRTDKDGTIIINSDGKNITVDCKGNSESTNTTDKNNIVNEQNQEKYVLNTNSKKIHLEGCSAVKDMSDTNKEYTTDYGKAIADGYKPCGICKP